MPKFILVIETAPRSKKKRYLVCKLVKDTENCPCPNYIVWEVHEILEGAKNRIIQLNLVP